MKKAGEIVWDKSFEAAKFGKSVLESENTNSFNTQQQHVSTTTNVINYFLKL